MLRAGEVGGGEGGGYVDVTGGYGDVTGQEPAQVLPAARCKAVQEPRRAAAAVV